MSSIKRIRGKAEWVEELQKKVFEECAAQNSLELPSEPLSTTETVGVVPVPVIVNYIQRNFSEIPYFRTDFLHELRKTLKEAAREDQVNWYEFRNSSAKWFYNLLKPMIQDGNNNIRLSNSDIQANDAEKDKLSLEEQHSCSDVIDEDLTSYSMNHMDTIASSCSLNSSSMGFGTTDSVIESSDTDNTNDNITGIDVNVKIRRINEETVKLKEELAQSEEIISSLDLELKSTLRKLDQITDKFRKLQKENDEQRESLCTVDKEKESCKLDLRKMEKAYSTSVKKIEELEKEKENILNLKETIEKLKIKNSEYLKQITDFKAKYEEKTNELECLKEEYDELQIKYEELEKLYEQNMQDHEEKIHLLNIELQSKENGSSNCSRLSITPPPYRYANVHSHSTPYNNKVCQDSLFTELKASGFNVANEKVQELKNELSFYNDEIACITVQIEESLQEITALKNQIHVPSAQLVETHPVLTLKQKVTKFLNLVKSYPITKVPLELTSTGEDSREKPDILPETKKSGCLANDRLCGRPEKQENDLIGSVTSSVPSKSMNGHCEKIDKSTSPLPEAAGFNANSENSQTEEIIVPIVEALNRIIELKGADEDEDSKTINLPTRNIKQKSIFTTKKTNDHQDWSNLRTDAKKGSTENAEYLNFKSCNDKGDGPHCDFSKVKNMSCLKSHTDKNTEMKTLNSECKECNAKQGDKELKVDMKYVTIRPNEKTYLVVSSTENKSEQDQPTVSDSKPEEVYLSTPVKKKSPCRKPSVFHLSFDVDSLQTPDSAQSSNNEKKRSISTPDVQEVEYRTKCFPAHDMPMIRNHLMNTYRCANNSDSSLSLSPKKIESTLEELDNEPLPVVQTINKPMIIAPSKFKLPDSTVNPAPEINQEVKMSKPIIAQGILQRNYSVGKISENEMAHQSAILSSSPNLIKKEEHNKNKDMFTHTAESCNDHSILSSESSNVSPTNIARTNISTKSMDISDIALPSKIITRNKTYTTQGAGANEPHFIVAAAGAPAASASAASTTAASLKDGSSRCNSNSNGSTGAGGGGVHVVTEGWKVRASAVGRAMSSGEDSSAESECNAALKSPQQPSLAEKTDDEEKRSTDECKSEDAVREDKVQTPPAMNGDGKENGCQKVTSNSSPQEIIKEDEKPKAFPSWTDQKLQESGLASYPDINSEISENLSEEELKKKYINFSVGLGTDRMTLTKRLILSRRQRDQAEKNFTNEMHKMQQDIKELAPLCVDSESVERVERVKQQLEMVARCAHRISCDAETLGAVHQERRVSRAVLLADKYLQTLRTKCEKLAGELTETKKILAENNIVLEENLSELSDDVPRVRYRAVPNNNRTMELPRQRNSVSGRVPGLRRPSLCYDTPKCEIEKLDRTDSSSSIAELRDISEQAESRRHSREENNNFIRTSINNLSTIASERTEEEEIWTNTRDDIVPDLANDNEIPSFQLGQNHRHPLICWLINRYTVWKSMIWGILIAFLVGFFINRIVSSSRRNGPPISWWSVEEILSQYVQVENEKHPVPRPI